MKVIVLYESARISVAVYSDEFTYLSLQRTGLVRVGRGAALSSAEKKGVARALRNLACSTQPHTQLPLYRVSRVIAH